MSEVSSVGAVSGAGAAVSMNATNVGMSMGAGVVPGVGATNAGSDLNIGGTSKNASTQKIGTQGVSPLERNHTFEVGMSQSARIGVNQASFKSPALDERLRGIMKQILDMQLILMFMEMLNGGRDDKARDMFNKQLQMIVGLELLLMMQNMGAMDIEAQMKSMQMEVSQDLSASINLGPEEMMEKFQSLNPDVINVIENSISSNAVTGVGESLASAGATEGSVGSIVDIYV